MRGCLVLAVKDLRQVLLRGGGAVQAVLLGLLLIFIFSLATPPGQRVPVQTAVSIFWLASCFGLVLVFNTLYRLEEQNGLRTALTMAPMPVQAIWLGKLMAGLVVLLVSQALFAPGLIVFLGLTGEVNPGLLFGSLMGVNLGLCILGSLIGAVSQGREARDSLMTIILFPLLVPLLLGGIRLGSAGLGAGDQAEASGWMGLVAAFDVVFAGAALLLFPYLYRGE
ncbi:MAG: heme ABC transporter permease CcmB [Deltaproteobacteria bacterium]|nr:heme ABC transporter permease CcmB [Deltaproteobacteria bacterium]